MSLLRLLDKYPSLFKKQRAVLAASGNHKTLSSRLNFRIETFLSVFIARLCLVAIFFSLRAI